MSSKSAKQPSNQNSLVLKQNIPVKITDVSNFDRSFALMKELFEQEMKRIDEHMNQFSSNLSQYYGGQASNVQTSLVSSKPNLSTWEALENSPLVSSEGNNKLLKLQFDVSQFDPFEVQVKLVNDLLTVTASHEEKTSDTTVYREYNRQFRLPPGTDPEMVVSSLSRDGVLTVQAPLPPPITDITSQE